MNWKKNVDNGHYTEYSVYIDIHTILCIPWGCSEMTGIWRGALHIVRYELRTSWGGMLLTLFMFTYFVITTLPFIHGILTEDSGFGKEVSWLVDLLYFCIMPNLGFLFNRSAWRAWREDNYSKRLALWQTMPIRIEQLIAGRLLLLVVVAIPTALLFFGVQYAALESVRDAFGIAAYLNYVITWLGFSMFWAVTYVYMELGFPGKMYMFICIAYVPVYGLMTWLLWMTGNNAVAFTLERAQAGDWSIAAYALIAAAAAFVIGPIFINRRIQSRSLWV